MKAFVIEKYQKDGGHLSQVPVPEPKAGEVQVEVHAAGINLLDSKIRKGEFKMLLPYKTPFILGHDLAGVVTKLGTGVRGFKVGDEVYARSSDYHIGTFAEFIAVPEADLALKPKGLSMEEAASIPLVALTAWQALVENGQLKKGQRVFIQAGSGGVGTVSIQLAKHLGSTVATTASAGNAALVKSLGADIIIDYRNEDFENVLNDYDLVLHSQDAKTLKKSLRVLRPGGKLISISGPPTPEFANETGLPWFLKLLMGILSAGTRRKAKKLGVGFSFLFMKADGSQLKAITALIDAGYIKPVMDKVFPFAQIKEAIAYVESSRAKGKVVIKIK